MVSRKLVSMIVVLGLIGSASAALNYEYYEAQEGAMYNALADVNFGEAVPVRTGSSDTLNSGDGNWVEQAGGHREDDFAFRYTGVIVVPISGDITFYTRSDDGSQLFIDGQMVVDNDGLHGASAFPGVPGTITLDAGVHEIEVVMFERGGGNSVFVAWSAGGQVAVSVPDSVLFLEAPEDISTIPVTTIVTKKAYGPNPSDGATELVDADVALLTWSPGYGAVSYDLYISVDEDIDAADLVGTLTDPNYAVTEPLVPGITYSWRVDCTDEALTTTEGDVWQISTLATEAHFESPADDGLWQIGINTELSWTPGLGAMVHHVYFSADKALVDARDMSVASMFLVPITFDPGELTTGTTYYWAVDEFGPAGTFAGPTWSFKAFAFAPVSITDPDLLIRYGFESGSGEMVNDLSGHENYGFLKGSPTWTTGIDGGGLGIDIATLDYVETGKPLGITSNTVTVCGWVKHDVAPAAWSGILTTRGSGNLGLQHDGSELRYMWGADLYWDFSSGLAIPNGEWYFSALTISPDQATLYLNGVDANSTATNVAPHDPVLFDSLIRVARDHQDSRIMTCTIDDVRFYNRTLSDQEILWAMDNLADVTGAGDLVQGVPNDGDWPGAEYPDLAIDNNVNTKFLHRKGGATATGIQVAPAAGMSVVTGLTLTTANDTPDRDPITFEVYGSNESIDGPYELIAAGDVNDFNQEAVWPRFTKNATTIAFDNTMAYAYYQVLFPTLRGATQALMQIAEVELIGEVLPLYSEGFESYAAGDMLQDVGGWAGWGGIGASAPVSDAVAYNGSNSVEIIGSADLVQEFELAGGTFVLSAMQYIPSGSTGTTYFILMNQYGAVNDWSTQTEFQMGTGEIKTFDGVSGKATILYDQWVELVCEVDLDANTVVEYYNGVEIRSGQWDDGGSGVFGAIDLYGNGASSVYYDNIIVK